MKSQKKNGISNSDLMMVTLTKFFLDKDNLRKMLNVVNGQSKVKLRVLDYFTTNYAKTHKVILTRTTTDENGEQFNTSFNVYMAYQSQLNAYSKELFDPFRRKKKIGFEVVLDDVRKLIKTTIGQLNFFRWIITTGILEYVEEHVDEIEHEMLARQHNEENAMNIDPIDKVMAKTDCQHTLSFN
jgi:hypothetical protein